MTKWEYAVEVVDAGAGVEGCQAELDELGIEGWELVSVVTQSSGDLLAFLKRPVQADPSRTADHIER